MIATLLRRKLDGELVRDARDIEDLLTGTVLGACQYLPPEVALLPFLAHARDRGGRRLGELLQCEQIHAAEYSFWPRWDEGAVGGVRVAMAEPDLVVELHSSGRRNWVLVEAKLGSGKSSSAGPGAEVTDQLSKYALQLVRQAREAGAHPMAVVYLTAGGGMPLDDIVESERELTAKASALDLPPLFWLSWRHFVPTTSHLEQPRLLCHLHEVLTELWGLSHAELRRWPCQPLSLLPWQFTRRWNWPVGADHRQLWTFGAAA